MIAFTVPGQAVPFARAGANGNRRFTPRRQADFMAEVSILASQAMGGEPPMTGPLSMKARFVYLVPASWSKRERADARWKSSKPDADNLVKILKDAMSKIVWADDAHVADLSVQKVYGPVAQVIISVDVAP